MGKNTFVNAGGPDPFEARLGTVLAGKWTLVRLIGVGGMAAVYEARHEIGRREAIKVLHPEVARQPELRKRFEQEAYAVNRLEHPSVVQIRDLGVTDDGCPFLVMELLEGHSLGERLLARSLTAEAALGHIDEVLDVLAVAHDEGIVHRDLKPENLFITSDDKLKVLDFGIARVRASSAMKVVTQTGTALGTPNYMPPEQIKGVDVDHRADLFAVGAILWELLTGRDIHEASSTQQLMMMMLTTPAPPLMSVAPHVGEPLARVVDRALAFEAEDRYPDARTMQADLREARAGRLPPFAMAAPRSIFERATMARSPQAISTTQGAASGAPPASLPATGGAILGGGPVSSAAVSRAAVSDPAVAFGPVSDPAVAFGPVSDPAVAFGPVSDPAVVFGPVSDPAVAFGPVSDPAVVFGPVSGPPVSGAPVSTPAANPTEVSAGGLSYPALSHAAAQSTAFVSEHEPSRQRRPLVAIILLGTLVGALATALVLRFATDDDESSAEVEDDGGRARPDDDDRRRTPSLRSSDDPATPSGAPSPGAGGGYPALPNPAPVGPSSDPDAPEPDPPAPEPSGGPSPAPEPPSPDPRPSPKPEPEPQPKGDPKPSVEPKPQPGPPPNKGRGRPDKPDKKKRKKTDDD